MGSRAVIYDRVSQADPESQDEHLRRCRDFASARGWDVVAEETDTASGFKRTARRPGWERVVAMVEADEVDVVVVFAVSRAGRNLARFASFVETCRDRGVAFASATEPIDTSGPMGAVVLTLLSALAEMESATKRERALVGRAILAREGRWGGGVRPFGFDVLDGRLVVNERESFLIRKAATDLLNGTSLRAIVNEWNDAEVETTGGKPWTQWHVGKTLTAPRIADGIITESDRRRIVDLTDSRKTGKRTTTPYLLTGLLWCHEHTERRLNGRLGWYACQYGGPRGRSVHLTIRAEWLDNHVLGEVGRHEDAEPFEPVEARDPADALVAERDRIVLALEALGESDLSEHVLRGRERKLVAELDAIEAKLEVAKPAAGAFWDAYVDDETFVRRHVSRILIGPGKANGGKPDPARVQIVWQSA